MDRRAFLAALGAAAFGGAAFGGARSLGASPRGDGAVALARSMEAADPHALVLGTVQDAGLPQVGCYSVRCDEGRRLHAEGVGRFVSSIALIEPESDRYYLVDATPDITRQIDLIDHPGFRRRAASRRPFDGIFLTHAHIGHYAGLAVLGNEGMGIRDTKVYCTTAMAAFLSANQPWAYMVEQGRIVPTPLDTDRWHRIDDHFEVQLWPVPHRDEFADTVAFVFRGPRASLLFLPDINDWHLWERSAVDAVASVDVALLDGSFWSLDELPGRSVDDVPHPLIRPSMDRFQTVADGGETRIVFTHLNNSNPALDMGGPEQREIERRGFAVAREGMRFTL